MTDADGSRVKRLAPRSDIVKTIVAKIDFHCRISFRVFALYTHISLKGYM